MQSQSLSYIEKGSTTYFGETEQFAKMGETEQFAKMKCNIQYSR